MNTCARIKSTGSAGRIHLSKATADLLVQGGKNEWIEKRQESVHAKGKGFIETYW